MSEVPDEEVPVYSTPQHSRPDLDQWQETSHPRTWKLGGRESRLQTVLEAESSRPAPLSNSEALANCNSELNVELPKIESLTKVVQRSRAKSNGSG